MRRYVESRPSSVFHVRGQFGLATENRWVDGKVWEKSTFAHLTEDKFARMLSSIQATNQKHMFE